jgi:hypothetical protein
LWVYLTPEPLILGHEKDGITLTLKVPPGALCETTYTYSQGSVSAYTGSVIADANGNATITKWTLPAAAPVGLGKITLTVTLTNGTKYVIERPYTVAAS